MSATLLSIGGRQDWAAAVALDWADRQHAWCMLAEDSPKRQSGQVENSPEALEQWINGLRQRYGERPVAVCLEQSRGSLVYVLSKYPQLVLFPVPPIMAASIRQAFHPSGAKDDPTDADLLLTILLHHSEQLRMLPADDESTRRIRLLGEQRRRLVDERTRQKNRLTSCLKTYYPQLMRWFKDISAPSTLAFLERWPDLEQAQKEEPANLKSCSNSSVVAKSMSSS